MLWYPVILIQTVVDHDGIFTFVDAGRVASHGDAFTYNQSQLQKKLEDGSWLPGPPRVVSGQWVSNAFWPTLLSDCPRAS